jgi:hypothetical protein
MPLSDQQMKKANRFFRLNGVVPDCPYCSMHGWDVGEVVSATVVDERGNVQPETASVPMAQSPAATAGTSHCSTRNALACLVARDGALPGETV